MIIAAFSHNDQKSLCFWLSRILHGVSQGLLGWVEQSRINREPIADSIDTCFEN